MARRHPVIPGSGARRAARLVLATSVLGLALATAPLAAGAQEAGSVPTLAQVLDGEVDGVSAEARATPADAGDMGVVVEFTNDGDDAVEVAIPFGTLVVTEQEDDQTLAVTPPPSPEVTEVAAAGGTPTIEVDAGTTSEELPAYCTELGDGYPYDGAAVTPIEAAHPVLADTLRAATVAGADHVTTQDAVWWLTDEPSVPVTGDLADLLAVDTAAFAASPHMVTPDTGYVPMWMRDEVPPGDGGSLETPSPYDEEEAAGIAHVPLERRWRRPRHHALGRLRRPGRGHRDRHRRPGRTGPARHHPGPGPHHAGLVPGPVGRGRPPLLGRPGLDDPGHGAPLAPRLVPSVPPGGTLTSDHRRSWCPATRWTRTTTPAGSSASRARCAGSSGWSTTTPTASTS